MIKLGANTHGFDHDQRFVSLTFAVVNSNTLWAVAPAHAQLAPPGYYMLFILKDGVPSKARMVRQTK